MEQFVNLERAIACPQATVAAAAETAAHALGQAGYRRGLGFGPTASYVRSYRPTWALVLAIIGAVPTLGLALLLLLVKSKDHCNVVIEDGPYGVVALVSGRVPASLPARLEAAVGHQVHGQPAMPGYHQQPPPMMLSPSGGQEPQAFSPQAILRPATPVPPLSTVDSPFPVPGSPFPVPGGYQPGGQQPGGQQPGGQQSGGQQQPPHTGWPSEAPRQPMPAHHRPEQPRPDPSRSEQPRPEQPRPEQPRYEPPRQQPAASGAGSEQVPAPVAFRPPSRLGPQPPAAPNLQPVNGGPGQPVNGQGANGQGANGQGVNGSGPKGSGLNGSPPSSTSEPDDDPFASTSGRVPWAVSGGRAAVPPPAPAWASAPPPAPAPPAAPVADAGEAALARPKPGGVATAVGARTPLLRVDSGELLAVGPFCLLGREPSARDGDPVAHLVKFDDVKLSVSKTHLAYGVDERGFWVVDRNSTNGTTVIEPSGQRIPCAPGSKHYVPIGGQVQIGQRRLTVEPAESAEAAS